MTTDWAALRELAERATPGPWKAWFNFHGDPFIVHRQNPHNEFEFEYVTKISTGAEDYGRADTEFIAAANPQVVAELIDENERLRAEVERLRGLVGTIYPCNHHEEIEWMSAVGRTVTAERDAALAVIEAVRSLHAPTRYYPELRFAPWCAHCSTGQVTFSDDGPFYHKVNWPCDTAKALGMVDPLAAAVGVDE